MLTLQEQFSVCRASTLRFDVPSFLQYSSTGHGFGVNIPGFMPPLLCLISSEMLLAHALSRFPRGRRGEKNERALRWPGVEPTIFRQLGRRSRLPVDTLVRDRYPCLSSKYNASKHELGALVSCVSHPSHPRGHTSFFTFRNIRALLVVGSLINSKFDAKFSQLKLLLLFCSSRLFL